MLRWENYFLRSNNDFGTFWRDYQTKAEPNILFIMGIGFDPRTSLGIKTIFSVQSRQKRDVIALRYYKTEEDVTESPTAPVEKHLNLLKNLLSGKANSSLKIKNLLLRSNDDKSIASISATNIIQNINDFQGYSDIVIDISAMPRSIFIPLINKSLDLIDNYNKENEIKKNLHVIACENSKLDSMIYDRGLDEEATFIHGFRIKQIDKTEDQKEVWIPILGENQTEQFDKIKVKLNPVEVCPVLPFPSENLRRGDNILIEFQDKLFNDPDFEAKNIVYVDESNPFQVYRLIIQTVERYNQSFELLNGCKIIVSALSSKLLTLGALLAVFEKKKDGTNIGIMHVEALKDELDDKYYEDKIDIDKNNKLFELWLTGEPYNEA